MLDFIGGLLIDLSLIVGIILFVMSFFEKYKEHKSKMLVVSLSLIAIGLIFFDISAVSEAYQNGVEWGESN